ncbi:protein FAM107B isoform X3 [Cynoglossus semilaevis]|uniref:protein FAM107B isoform X3 n=1 Tax=Cynoglossus semilaevis TaxID=244447 RepID=UPI000D62A6F1|nr:protein FAM107B-like isoform X3 [Cynoglossus semilaevis]
MMTTAQTNSHRKANEDQAEVHSGHSSPTKPFRTQNELHKELLLAHKRGVALSHRSELQQVLERRKRVQSDQEEEQQSKTPLDDVLLRRQQKQHECFFWTFLRERRKMRKKNKRKPI